MPLYYASSGMHTVMVMVGGFTLLGVCILVARLTGETASAMARGAIVFIPLWLLFAAVNMWFGMVRGGYSAKDELTVFAVVFSVPAALALIVFWRLHAR